MMKVWLLVIGSLVAGCWLLVISAAPVWAGCVQTEIGCIPTDAKGLAQFIFNLAMGLAGGVAVLLIAIGGLRIMASQGDPKAVVEGREMITAAITGLLLIVFSIVILRAIGVSILGF